MNMIDWGYLYNREVEYCYSPDSRTEIYSTFSLIKQKEDELDETNSLLAMSQSFKIGVPYLNKYNESTVFLFLGRERYKSSVHYFFLLPLGVRCYEFKVDIGQSDPVEFVEEFCEIQSR